MDCLLSLARTPSLTKIVFVSTATPNHLYNVVCYSFAVVLKQIYVALGTEKLIDCCGRNHSVPCEWDDLFVVPYVAVVCMTANYAPQTSSNKLHQGQLISWKSTLAMQQLITCVGLILMLFFVWWMLTMSFGKTKGICKNQSSLRPNAYQFPWLSRQR